MEAPKYSLPLYCNIHTGELYGIYKLLYLTQDIQTKAVGTDNLSSITSIENIFTQHPIVLTIHEMFQRNMNHSL